MVFSKTNRHRELKGDICVCTYPCNICPFLVALLVPWMDLDEGLTVSSSSVIAITVPKRRMVFPQAVNSSSVMTNKMILQNHCDLKIRTRSATEPIGKMCE